MNYKNDFAIIKSRMNELHKSSSDFVVPKEEFSEILKTYRNLTKVGDNHDGAYIFRDVDYTLTHDGFWPWSSILDRTSKMLKAYDYATEEEKSEILDLVSGHLTQMAYGEYKNDNWWAGDIGLPMGLSRILMLSDGLLNEELKLKLIHLMDQGSVKCRPEILAVKNAYHSGANLTWYCINSLHRAVLLEDPEEIFLVVEGISKETNYGAYEGIQEDMSYFQHHRRIYTHGYGTAFPLDCARIFYYTAGTKFAFPEYAKSNIVNYVLDGARYCIGGCGTDYMLCGRNLARVHQFSTNSWKSVVEKLLTSVDIPRRDELEDMLKNLKEGKTPAEGVKLFPISKLLTTHPSGTYISFKGTDPTLYQAECNPDENYLGINMSYGCNLCIMKEGTEYSKIHVLWDYDSVPGTTSRYESDESLKSRAMVNREGFSWYKVESEDYGCAQSSDLAVCFIGAENYGVYAKVSAFATPFGMIVLGTDLKDAINDPLHTTINQCNAMGDVTIKDNGKEVTHAAIVYKNLDSKTSFRTKIEHKEYNYRRNYFEDGKPFHIEGDVFTIDIPTNTAHTSYAYMILPEEMKDRWAKVIVNNGNAQGIMLDDGRCIIVFHTDGKIVLEDGREVSGKALDIKFI